MRHVACAIVILGAIARLAWPQPPRDRPVPALPPAQSSTLTGRVVSEGSTRTPLSNARVSVATSGGAVVLTDGDGRFALAAPRGPVTISATKTGYAKRTLVVDDTRPFEIRLRRAAAISGRIVDELGDPTPSVRVIAVAAASAASKDRAAIAAEAFTDDRGEYRLGGVAPGTVVVRADGVGGMRIGLPEHAIRMMYGPTSTYYPGTVDVAAASPLVLRPGDEIAHIDFAVPAGQPYFGGPPIYMGPLGARRRGDARQGGSGAIHGRVLRADTRRPIPHALVRIVGSRYITPMTVLTRDDGTFEATELVSGTYTILASRGGYTPLDDRAAARSSLTSKPSVTLADGETKQDVDAALAPWGSISGRIVDEYGDPVQGARVQALQVRFASGRRRLVSADAASAATDDLGRYRLYGVMPRQYVVSASVGDVSSIDLPGYTRSYFPGTIDVGQAQFVSAGVAGEVDDVDFALARAPTARITGRVVDANGGSAGGILRLVPAWRSGSLATVPVGARLLGDTFAFDNVPPGNYVIQAYQGLRNPWTEGEFGSVPIAVNGTDVSDVVVQRSIGSTVTGRFVFDASEPDKRPSPGAIELMAVPVDYDAAPPGRWATADIGDGWTFRMIGLNGPRRLQLTGTPSGWSLEEIRVRGADATDRALRFGSPSQSLSDVEVVLTDRAADLAGSVVDDRGAVLPHASVILFATDRGFWYASSRFLRTTAADAHGAFTLSGLPGGTYFAAVVRDLPDDGEDGWQDPEFLESLVPLATTITIGEGERQALNLRVR